ncbi:ribose-5-phosphate isomerase RpiA [Neomegalonema sp.]|uniref:ribose-5-phosphate isomerase RpiA n=1 Tax=Neomegalonema sp. TaxID=2039713 RepID=UPI0026242F8B|nr:ribose-5-phosphate isomerase RpiA [Neomegalonema sp.]MDD2869135.1 ribose-5-phosphate isomerase RpiA [Neomegalonema sp.]
MTNAADKGKKAAAEQAVALVEPGMRLGLGTGSTAEIFVKLLGARAKREKLELVCAPTSIRTGELAESVGLKLATLNELGWLDLTVDGADEIDPELRLIKGGGGALLVEKIVAAASNEMVVIADSSKKVERLGAFPLPIEVVKFGWRNTAALIEQTFEEFGCRPVEGQLRMLRGAPFLTDEGHYILDYPLESIPDPDELAIFLPTIPGVVDSGLFIDYATRALIGAPDGSVELLALDDEEDED